VYVDAEGFTCCGSRTAATSPSRFPVGRSRR
jgi:hypothetical protein